MRRWWITCSAWLAVAATQPALAEVRESSADGFVSLHSLEITASPARTWAALGSIGRWWSSAHTWSGDARNLRLKTDAGECFCERWKDGSVEHGRVVMARRDALLRLQAILGPLQAMAVNATLTFTLKSADEGTRLEVEYRVNGSSASGLDTLATPVDRVIGEQAGRLQRFVETGSAD